MKPGTNITGTWSSWEIRLTGYWFRHKFARYLHLNCLKWVANAVTSAALLNKFWNWYTGQIELKHCILDQFVCIMVRFLCCKPDGHACAITQTILIKVCINKFQAVGRKSCYQVVWDKTAKGWYCRGSIISFVAERIISNLTNTLDSRKYGISTPCKRPRLGLDWLKWAASPCNICTRLN